MMPSESKNGPGKFIVVDLWWWQRWRSFGGGRVGSAGSLDPFGAGMKAFVALRCESVST